MSDRQTMTRPTSVSVDEPTLADQVMGRQDDDVMGRQDDDVMGRQDDQRHEVESEQERTQAWAPDDLPERDEAAELAAARQAERERRRAERERALGTRHKVEDLDEEPAAAPKRTTDKFPASFGLFVLRLVTAAIMGLHGVAHLLDKTGTEQMLNSTIVTTWIPRPDLLNYVLAVGEIAIALGLLLGAFTRLAGFGTAVILILALAVKVWVVNPFQSGYSMVGETELLLAGIGILFLCVGGGAWGMDGAFRRSQSRVRDENFV